MLRPFHGEVLHVDFRPVLPKSRCAYATSGRSARFIVALLAGFDDHWIRLAIAVDRQHPEVDALAVRPSSNSTPPADQSVGQYSSHEPIPDRRTNSSARCPSTDFKYSPGVSGLSDVKRTRWLSSDQRGCGRRLRRR